MITYVCVGGNRRELSVVQSQLIIISSTGKDKRERKKKEGKERERKGKKNG